MVVQDREAKISNFLNTFPRYVSYILRHNPSYLGISLEEGGWTDRDIFIEKIITSKALDWAIRYNIVSREQIELLLESNNDLEIKEGKIRALIGHSIENLIVEYQKGVPSKYLYHATDILNTFSIFRNGLIPAKERKYVFLAGTSVQALNIILAKKYPPKKIVVLEIVSSGSEWYKHPNKEVYFTDCIIPPSNIKLLNGVTYGQQP